MLLILIATIITVIVTIIIITGYFSIDISSNYMKYNPYDAVQAQY